MVRNSKEDEASAGGGGESEEESSSVSVMLERFQRDTRREIKRTRIIHLLHSLGIPIFIFILRHIDANMCTKKRKKQRKKEAVEGAQGGKEGRE